MIPDNQRAAFPRQPVLFAFYATIYSGQTPPFILDANTEPKHLFYFKDVGPYNIPGRDTNSIIGDLKKFNVSGREGEIAHLTAMQNKVDEGENWASFPLMGRKFESERAIFLASKNALIRMNSTISGYDLVTTNFGPIIYVQVKWSLGPIPESTINKVASDAKLYPSGTFLLESNYIDDSARSKLIKKGGFDFPFPYP